MTMLICFALKEEAAPFRKIAAGKSGVAILLTGIGRQNAGKSIRKFLSDWGSARLRRAVFGVAPKTLTQTNLCP
jgi:hypothetical protein